MRKKLFIILLVICSKQHLLQAQRDLPYYLEKAAQNSPLLKDYKNQVSVNALETERLKAFYTKAQLAVNGNYLFAPIVSTDNNSTRLVVNPQSANHYYGADISSTSGGLYQGLLVYTQPLLGKARYEATAEQVAVTSQISSNNMKLSLHDLQKQVTEQYILCLSDKAQLQFTDSTLSLIKEQEAIVQKLVAASLLKQSDLTLLHIEYDNMNALHTTWQASYNRDVQDMNILCGLQDSTATDLQNIHLFLTATPDSSSFMTKYQLDSLNLQALQKVSDMKYKPQLNLAMNAGINTVYFPVIPQRIGFTAGLSFILPIYDGHQRRITHQKTDIQLQTNQAYKDNFTLQNEARIHKIAAELTSYQKRKEIAEKQLQEYESLLSTYKKEIIQGQLSVINYITVLKNRITAQRDYLLLKSNEQLLINTYNYWNW